MRSAMLRTVDGGCRTAAASRSARFPTPAADSTAGEQHRQEGRQGFSGWRRGGGFHLGLVVLGLGVPGMVGFVVPVLVVSYCSSRAVRVFLFSAPWRERNSRPPHCSWV